MTPVLRVQRLRKRVFVAGHLGVPYDLAEQEVGLLFEGIRSRAELSILRRNPHGSFQIIILDCGSGSFDLDERLRSCADSERPGVEIEGGAGAGGERIKRLIIPPSKVDADVELYGAFAGERQSEDRSVRLLLDGENLGPFIAYEPDVGGGDRRMNVVGVSASILEKLSAALSRGAQCDWVAA